MRCSRWRTASPSWSTGNASRPARSDAVRSNADGARGLSRRGRPVMLKVEGLQASYGRSRVLSDISLSVGEGEVVTLLGRNGMGKTTTIRSIMGLIPPLAGAITFVGRCHRGASAGDDRPRRHRPGAGRSAGFSAAHRGGKSDRHRGQSSRPRRTRGPCSGSISSFPACRSGPRKWAARCRAASSRCWRSAAR